MKKEIIQFSILFALLITANTTMAQQHDYMPQWYISTGFSKATFEDYVSNNEENSLDNTGYASQEEPVWEAGYRFDIYRGRVKFELGSLFRKHEINTTFRSGNIRIPTTYNMSYVGLKFGFRVNLLRWKKLKLQVHTHFSNDWLISGTSRFENTFNDIYKERTLDRVLLNLHQGFGLEYQITDVVSTSLTFNEMKSFKEWNQDSTHGERFVLKAQAVSLGILINVPKN